LEYDHGCHNYNSIEATIVRGEGVHVWDVEGNKYLDFIAGISSVNQGHVHPKIYKTLVE